MRVSRYIKAAALAVIAAFLPALANAADNAHSVNIPQLTQAPQFSDFAGMAPATALARQMGKIEGFVQREPTDGAPASQRTEVYLGYDQERLYAIFLAFDSDPSQIRANLASRENIGGDDTVELTIDTFNDQRAAYTFRVTPLGMQWDARWTEGFSNRAGFDTTWEAVWDSDGEVNDQGYMVRIAVPLRGLRFPETAEQQWRVQVGRQIPRITEESFWPPYSITRDGRLNQAALLNGIRNVSPGSNTQIIPFMFARSVDSVNPSAPGGPAFERDTEYDLGVDAKFVFNDAWVLDLTLNPDFSQVESDEPQVTVNERFEVQYPERRPFFVENADFFATASILLFTRRIVDPEGGLRLTGRQGNWGFGTMLMNDEAPGLNRADNDPLNGEKANIAVFRAYRDLQGQDRVGMMFTDRELLDGYNRVLSMDGKFRLNQNWVTNLELIGTDTEPTLGGDSISGIQRNVRIDRVARTYNTHIHYVGTDEDFRTQLGFQNRFFKSDISGIHNRHDVNFFPENSILNSWSVGGMLVYQDDQAGTKVYSEVSPSFNFNFPTSRITVGMQDVTEVLRPKDFAGLLASRVYDYGNVNLRYRNTALASLTFDLQYRNGTALNLVPPRGTMPSVADSVRYDVSVLWRPLERLRIDNSFVYSELESRRGAGKVFSNEIFRSSWNYQFTREMSLRFIAQYEQTDAGPATRLTDDENMNFDVLLRYVINPWSALYLGYNSNSSNFDIVEVEGEREIVTTDDLKKDGDQFFVKFSYMFQR
ncbi:MAG: hypothetical protein A3H44_07590 [Gammaproteobacteria bacterium RIFCSPLOWO2_02_FULL_57_10]|nr:MAG: hypothetical protein A3H44_07590 [Gammaproteobacteria bacterium RIFCSPLOWO2_02_FULL_57_10]